MRRGIALCGTAALVVFGGAAWVLGPGSGGGSLDAEAQVVVDAVESDEFHGDSTETARFVDANLDVLLSEDVAGALAGDLAELFDTALRADDDLLGRTVAAVAAEGAIHSDELRPVFAEVTTTRMAWVDEQINAPAAFSARELPDDVAERYLDMHDFLRETMRDAASAERLRQAMDDYGLAETAAAPDSGEVRDKRLRQLGRVHAFFDEAQRNAERGPAIRDEDLDALEAAEARNRARRVEGLAMRQTWVLTDLFNSAGPVGDDVRKRAEGQPFVDASGSLKVEMTDEEARVFQSWAETLSEAGRPASHDLGSIGSGSNDITQPTYGLFIEDRY